MLPAASRRADVMLSALRSSFSAMCALPRADPARALAAAACISSSPSLGCSLVSAAPTPAVNECGAPVAPVAEPPQDPPTPAAEHVAARATP